MSTSVSQATNSVPEPIAHVADLMSTYDRDWALGGGWAVDAWLGRVTRDHGDIDVIVFDQGTLFEYLPGWQLLAHDPVAPEHDGEWWDGQRRLSLPSHIHARPPEFAGPAPKNGIATAEDGFTLEFQIDERSQGEWVLAHQPSITRSLEECVRISPWGVPTVVPEVLLLYKAGAEQSASLSGNSGFMRRRDKLDFLALAPILSDDQRDWLREAISLVGHPWLAQLAT